MSRILLPAFLIFSVAGCVTTTENAFKMNGLDRAAFELGCTKAQVQVTVLKRNDNIGCAGAQVGVKGCGKKAVYVCTGVDWINNTGVDSAD